MTEVIEAFQTKLKLAGHSVTNPRQAVFVALQDREPQTMAQLIESLPEIDRASIYRTVELFVNLGIIERLQFGWKYKLELSDEFSHHHHHMSCIKCHKVIALQENSTLENLLKRLAKEADFQPTGHQIEIRGYCEACKT
jgi:Fur family ferric uptake transcriptional regulator